MNMISMKVKLKDLKMWERNPQQMEHYKFEALKNSIKEFGFVEPLIINKNNEIIGGNHRYLALLELFGLDYEVDVIVVDLPKVKEKKLNIALNSLHGDFNSRLLSSIIQEIISEEEDLFSLGFTKEELNAINLSQEIKVDEIEKFDLKENLNLPEKVKEKSAREIICPHCHRPFSILLKDGRLEYFDSV